MKEMFKKPENMDREEYEILERIFTAHAKRENVNLDELQFIYNTYISKAVICRTCNSMIYGVFSKVIRFFGKHIEELRKTFSEPVEPVSEPVSQVEVDPSLYQVEIINKEVIVEEPKDKYKYEKCCLNCSTIFKTNIENKLYCSTECKTEFNNKRINHRKKKNNK